MRRAVSLWLPTWSTDLVGRRLRRAGIASADGAVILTERTGSRELVARCCALARAAGVAPGVDLTHARSLLPAGAAAHIETHRPDRDAAALRSLACWTLRYSPVVAVDPPDGLLIDATGLAPQYPGRGEAGLLQALGMGMRRLGFSARAAIASTFACAWGIARFGEKSATCVPPGGERAAIEPLPIASLGVDPATLHALREIGLTCAGHVLNLPRSALAARFGEDVLRRADRVLGRAAESIDPVHPQPPPRAELVFEGPTDRWEALEAAARQVLDALVDDLARRERGVRQLDLEVLRPLTPAHRASVQLSRPSRAPRHLWTLLRTRLERVDMGEGVEGIVLSAPRTARLRHRQAPIDHLGLEEPAGGGGAAWGELVDTLVNRLGCDEVVRFEPVESHLPERAFRERSVMESPGPRSAPAVTAADRPTRLLARPEPARVMALTPDGPVLSVHWREQEWRALSCSGPERLGAEWWRWQAGEPPPDRDYFAVQAENGRWLWVCRQVDTGRWFVHGEWG